MMPAGRTVGAGCPAFAPGTVRGPGKVATMVTPSRLFLSASNGRRGSRHESPPQRGQDPPTGMGEVIAPLRDIAPEPGVALAGSA